VNSQPGSSKADILRHLVSSPTATFVIDKFVVFDVHAWRTDATAVLEMIRRSDLAQFVVVRSSALNEDTSLEFAPGVFISRLGVDAGNDEALRGAIDAVIASYWGHPIAKHADGANHVIVQTQCRAALLAGVMDTGDRESPYVVVFFSRSGVTNAVTRGDSAERVALYHGIENQGSLQWRLLLLAAAEVAAKVGFRALIEFALDHDNVVHVFQARPIRTSSTAKISPAQNAVRLHLNDALKQIDGASGPWSDMSDWNPAEMLGDRPRPLSTSLYEYLVTDSAWLTGRVSLGYRNISPAALLETVCGKPYVNIRRSFLSLTPAQLSDDLASRLVEDRVAALREAPELHDKVEHSLLFTSADVRAVSRTQALRLRGFLQSEVNAIDGSLRDLTRHTLNRWSDLVHSDDAITKQLLAWRVRHELDTSGWRSASEISEYVTTALRVCRDRGVVPFARQARLAFMGQDILNGLAEEAALDADWIANWWRGTNSISNELAQALSFTANGVWTRERFNAEFGHLRPRTYDITCPRYDTIRDLPYPTRDLDIATIPEPILSSHEAKSFAKAFARIGSSIDTPTFLSLTRKASTAREQTKFAFSAILSDVLEAIAALGEMVGLTREALSMLTLGDLTQLTAASGSLRQVELLQRTVFARHNDWTAAQAVEMPDLIFSSADLLTVRHYVARPNYITQDRVCANVLHLATPFLRDGQSVDGKIVLVEAADPGMDWLFSLRIAGLITQYGGALSHMAVRCLELGIPAAIGCGLPEFRRVAQATTICLDCAEERVEIIV
jgi:phosphohistidine swiveling domain-containing protein